jgi:hypothetical protein
MSTRRHILAAALALTGLLAANTNAQDKTKGTGMTFHGKVEAVTDKGLTVNGEKVEGWMDAMTMSYPLTSPRSSRRSRSATRSWQPFTRAKPRFTT